MLVAMSETSGLPAPDLEVLVDDDAPAQTDNSGEFDLLPQDPNWRPGDATDVAP